MAKIKDKERISKASREKQQSHKNTGLSADFSAEAWQARREQHNSLKAMEGKTPETQNTLFGKVINHTSKRNKEFYRKKSKRGFRFR